MTLSRRNLSLFASIMLLLGLFSGNGAAATPDYLVATSNRLVVAGQNAADEQDYEGAVHLLEQAMVANPKNIFAYVTLGQTHVAQGQYGLGIRYFDIALSIDPADLPTLEAKAMANLQRQNLDEARESFRVIQQVCEIRACEELLRVGEALVSYENSNPGN
jgi:tetratricopeptide (TPR) repeat protein